MKIEVGSTYTATLEDADRAQFRFYILHCAQTYVLKEARKYYVGMKVCPNGKAFISEFGALYWFNQEGLSLGDCDFRLKRKTKAKTKHSIHAGKLHDPDDDYWFREEIRRDEFNRQTAEREKAERAVAGKLIGKAENDDKGLGKIRIQCSGGGRNITWNTGLLISREAFDALTNDGLIEYIILRGHKLPPKPYEMKSFKYEPSPL